jgi:pimeloyl-ACP methyl ester carboxylesterase
MDDEVVLADGPWTHRQVSANGARFHVVEAGTGPVVLLLHGFPTFWWTWRHQLIALADAGYRAVAMDLRGYGGSDKTPRGYDPLTLTDDVGGVIRSLGAQPATVVGHGWGGLLGWTLAALEPALCARLVVVAAAHPRRMRTAITRAGPQLAASSYALGFQYPWVPERRLVREDAARIAELLRAWSGHSDWPEPDTLARYRRAVQIDAVAHCAMEYHRWAFRSFFRPDGASYARRMRSPIRAPVLQLHGSLDPVVLPSTAAGSGRHVAGPYRWAVIPGAGHFPHEERPAQFNTELLAWLNYDGPSRT